MLVAFVMLGFPCAKQCISLLIAGIQRCFKGIVHQLMILHDGLFGDGENDSKAVFLNATDGTCQLGLCSCLDSLKGHDVMNGLSRDDAGEMIVDDVCRASGSWLRLARWNIIAIVIRFDNAVRLLCQG